MKISRFLLAAGLAPLAGCSTPEPEPAADSVTTVFEAPGAYPVGNRSVVLTDDSRERSFRVEFWYPADESARVAAEAGQPVENFMHDATSQAVYKEQLAQAPEVNGPKRRFHAATDAPVSSDQAKWPLVLFSHCYDCSRFSVFTIAERLASHGFAVAAPDHTGGTLFEHLTETSESLGPEFLEVRAGDIRFVIDRALDGEQLPEALHGKFDPDAIGMFGHSFGGATTGRVLMLDKRPKAGLALAVPMESALLPGVTVADINVPLFFLVAVEDNSIFEIGNRFIRENFAAANAPAWKLEMKDAGHFSFTDICGILPSHNAGCVREDRQTSPGDYFDYISADIAREIAAAYVTAFFAATLRDDAEAEKYLSSGRPAEWATVEGK
jgi:predicted dienelactone hydrolase